MSVVDADETADGDVLPLIATRRPRTAPFVSVRDALADLAAGKMVMLVDDERRTNVGHLMLPADKVTAEQVAFLVRYSTGLLRAALSEADCERLGLPLMAPNNENPRGTA